MRRGIRRTGLTAAALGACAMFVAATTAAAQDVPPEPEAAQPTRSRTRANPLDPNFQGALLGDASGARAEGDEMVVHAVGGKSQPIWLKVPGMELRCDAVVIWGARGRLMRALGRRTGESSEGDAAQDGGAILGPVIHAVYAEGNVFLRRDNHTVKANKLFLDFAENRAYMLDTEMRADFAERQDGPPIPLTIRAGVIRGIAKDRFLAQDPSFTTCSYHDPHIDFTTDTLELELHPDYVWFKTGWFPQVRAQTPFGKTPILVLPILGGRNFDLRPLQDISYSNSSRFGGELRLEWGGEIPDGEDRWGTWTLHTDYLSRRGVGLGVDLELDGRAGVGGAADNEFELLSFWQRDTARKDDYSERAFDGLPGGSTTPDRGRMHLWFRTEEDRAPGSVDKGWRLDGELAWYSDRGFLPEYVKDETLTEKQQETFLHARRTWGNAGLSATTSYRLNEEAVTSLRGIDATFTDFQNQTEATSLTYHLINQPVLEPQGDGLPPVNLSLQVGAGRFERRYDDRVARRIRDGRSRSFGPAAGWRSKPVFRGDVEARVSAPFSVGPVHFTPTFGGSFLATDEANGFRYASLGGRGAGSTSRGAGFAGVRADVQFARTFDVQDDLLQLDGLRHVMSFDAQYFDRFHVSRDRNTFQGHDLIDELDEQQIGSFRMRQRLQTKRDGKIIDLIDAETRFLHFFDPLPRRRYARFGAREDFAQPLQRLDVPGEDKFAFRNRDGNAFLQQRIRVRLRENLFLIGEGDHDLDAREWETTAAGIRWFVDDRFSVYAGRRTIRHDSIIWTIRGDYRFSDRWGFGAQYQENTANDKGLRTTFTVFRRAHDYTLALELDSEDQLDETSVSFAIYPNHWLNRGRSDPFRERRPLDFEALRWYR